MGDEVQSLNFSSIVTRSRLDKLELNYGIPADIHLRVPNPGKCVANPPSYEVAFYLAMFLFGVCLPLHLFCQSFLLLIQLAPTQIVPNRWSHLLSFYSLWAQYNNGSPLLGTTFISFHTLRFLANTFFI